MSGLWLIGGMLYYFLITKSDSTKMFQNFKFIKVSKPSINHPKYPSRSIKKQQKMSHRIPHRIITIQSDILHIHWDLKTTFCYVVSTQFTIIVFFVIKRITSLSPQHDDDHKRDTSFFYFSSHSLYLCLFTHSQNEMNRTNLLYS